MLSEKNFPAIHPIVMKNVGAVFIQFNGVCSITGLQLSAIMRNWVKSKTMLVYHKELLISATSHFLAITVLLDVKDIPQVGPLQWGWISIWTHFFCRLLLNAGHRTSHASAGGGCGRSSAMSRKISWNICRAMATSAIWKMM
jgi:hypothetical protein